jgi:hypothetical protein
VYFLPKKGKSREEKGKNEGNLEGREGIQILITIKFRPYPNFINDLNNIPYKKQTKSEL